MAPHNSLQYRPLNDVYLPYFFNTSRYLVLYGGSGSGKSVFASQKIIGRLLSEPGHRFLVIRKVGRTLRESVFKRIENELAAQGYSCEFSMRETFMNFTHRPTGNEIILAGLDDVEKLKSIETITGIWIEEATELSQNDFDQLDLRLRGQTKTYKQIILSFNPIDETHWLKARFFDNPPDNCTVLKTTFKDNQYIDAEYGRVLEQKIRVSPNLYRIYYLGEWGKEEVQRPYVHNFNPQKHVSTGAVFNPMLPVYLSIDFNVEPFVCICAHLFTNATGMHYHIFKELVIEKNGDVYKMLDLIVNTFDTRTLANCYITGDAMQRKREITQQNNIDAWRIIDNRLQLNRRLMVPKANPSVRENRHLVNAICAFHPDLQIHPQCTKLIYDLQYVEADEEGNLLKTNRQQQAQRADALDTFRYQCNTHLPDFLERHKV
jgi:hypothetical protein